MFLTATCLFMKIQKLWTKSKKRCNNEGKEGHSFTFLGSL